MHTFRVVHTHNHIGKYKISWINYFVMKWERECEYQSLSKVYKYSDKHENVLLLSTANKVYRSRWRWRPIDLLIALFRAFAVASDSFFFLALLSPCIMAFSTHKKRNNLRLSWTSSKEIKINNIINAKYDHSKCYALQLHLFHVQFYLFLSWVWRNLIRFQA